MFHEGQEILEKRYKVIKKLGGGAFGEIYKGTVESLICLKFPNLAGSDFKSFYSWEEKDRRTFSC